MRKKITVAIVVGAVFLAGITYSAIELYQWWNDGRLIQQEAEEIAEDFLLPEDKLSEDESTTESQPMDDGEPVIEQSAEERNTDDSVYTLDFDKLYSSNSEAIGWIRVDGTSVNYPVVQSTNNSKYMKLNIYGEYSSAGTPFLDCTNCLEPQDSNLVIYGHNMGVGRTSAFSTLIKYRSESHWNRYPTIWLNLKGEDTTWRIFAVMEFNIDDLSEYNYTTHNFLTPQEKVAFAEEAKNRSIYDTGIVVTEDDHILTLSTCDRNTYGTKGRIVIMAVQE